MKGFRLKEVCTTEKGARYVATTYACDERYGVETHEYYGIRLMPENYSNPQVEVGADTLSFCGENVEGYDYWVRMFPSLSINIPRYYVIREYDYERGFYSFVCGCDLLDDGRVWQGITRTYYPSILDAIKFIREKYGNDFSIDLEEPMQIGQAYD